MTIDVEKKDGIATLTLNRPEKNNALDGGMIHQLNKLLEELTLDPQIRVLMIKANGAHFCAGADIKWMMQMAEGSFDENARDAEKLADMLYHLYQFPKPTIALAHGATLGGGMGLLSAVDIALCTQTASFGFSEVKLGLTPSTISPYVIKAIGERNAHYYFLTGERFDASTAQQIGLIHRIYAESQLVAEGQRIANLLLENSPKAMQAAKMMIRQFGQGSISKELAQRTAEHLAEIRSSKQARVGLSAFLAKRKPEWT